MKKIMTGLLFVMIIVMGNLFSNPIEIENLLDNKILGKWQIHDKYGKAKVVSISNEAIYIYNSNDESSGYLSGTLSRVIKSDEKDGVFSVKFTSVVPKANSKDKIKKINKYEEWKYLFFNNALVLLERTNAIDEAQQKSFHEVIILRRLKK